MGTSGKYGFYYEGKYYWFYNHWDSYPSGLGADLIMQLEYAIDNNLFDAWKCKLSNMKYVNDDNIPSEDDINRLEKYTDLTVGSQSTNDWYCLTRKCQGSIQNTIDSGVCIDIIYPFVVFGYLINFDDNTFTCYGDSKEFVYKFDDLPNFKFIDPFCCGDNDGENQ